jgi:hypothetical protein
MKMIKRVIGCNVVNGGSCVYACIWELYGGYMGGIWDTIVPTVTLYFSLCNFVLIF